jgi:membrane protease subunit HflK
MFQRASGKPEFDPEQVLQQVKAFLGRLGVGGSGGGGAIIAYITWGVLAIALLIWAASGVYTVNPGEQAIKRTFGKFSGLELQGLHWHWPNPVGNTRVVAVEQTRQMELGFRSTEGGLPQLFQIEARMITGDLNVVDTQLVVQYRIGNLEHFIFNVSDPGDPARLDVIEIESPEGRTLKDATEAALRGVVGQRGVDAVLVERRSEVQSQTQLALQGILDQYETGITVLAVILQDVTPPAEVKDAFDDVLRARQEQDTAINLAQAYERDQLPRAQGNAARVVQAGEAFKKERIAKAEGEAGRFEAVLAEYLLSEDVTRQRLYLEAMEAILPNVSKFIVSPDAGGSIILNAAGQSVVPVPELSVTAPAALAVEP